MAKATLVMSFVGSTSLTARTLAVLRLITARLAARRIPDHSLSYSAQFFP